MSHFSPLHMDLERACQALYKVFHEAGGLAPTEAVAYVVESVFTWSEKVIDAKDRTVRDDIKDEVERLYAKRTNDHAT